MTLVGDGVLAVAQGVPELDGAVTGAGHDLAVIGRERDGKDIAVVANESAGGVAAGKLPEAERLVPGGGQSVGTVGGDHLEITNASGQPSDSSILVGSISPKSFVRHLLICGISREGYGDGIHSQKQCASDPQGCAWGSRRPARRG